MKKLSSELTIVKCEYVFEYIKESLNQFLALLSVEIKNRLGENVQLIASLKDGKLHVESNNKKVYIICNVNNVKCAIVDYRYQENKVCDYVEITLLG